MKKILRIGEFSKINHISIQTLRFYDQIGLLRPYEVDPETNYRYYHINQSSLVDSIQYLRQLDFSLKEIKEILSDRDQFHLHRLIEERYQQLLQEKEMLEERIKEIEIFRSGAQLYGEKQTDQKLEIVAFPERHILSFSIDQNIYQLDNEEYELYLRYFKQEILNYNPFFNNFSRVGSIMKRGDFLNQNWFSNQFCLFHQTQNELPNLIPAMLPKGSYAVTYCSSFEEEVRNLPHFHQELADAGYLVTGDYICEVIHEQPQLNEKHRDMFIRMQVQVESSWNITLHQYLMKLEKIL